MSNYVLAYPAPTEPMSTDEATVNQVMAAWGAWFESLGDALVDGGAPFGRGVTLAPDGSHSDGVAFGLGGYSVVRADSIEGAAELAAGCPIHTEGAPIGVYEAIEM